MAIMLGGPTCWRKHEVKSRGLCVFFEWWNDEKDALGSGEPALFITRLDRFGLSGNRGSACITLPQAFQYAHSRSGDWTERLIKFSMGACTELGLEPSRQNVKKIAETILDFLPDLVKMPPAPDPSRFASRKGGGTEVALLADGKIVAEAEV